MSFGLVGCFGLLVSTATDGRFLPRANGFARKKTEGPHWAGLRRVSFRGDLLLRAGPPEVGVIIRAIIVVAGQHEALRGKRSKVAEAGGDEMHGPT
ncbi:hypothetical protein ACPPVV_08400 [Rhodanobacter sp. Col0626]|uniref:hypothetical protein n=1 Tax=Rhodanobacter sp. Col0626 TaxID=3415679 RepID=UPI003CFB2E70